MIFSVKDGQTFTIQQWTLKFSLKTETNMTTAIILMEEVEVNMSLKNV